MIEAEQREREKREERWAENRIEKECAVCPLPSFSFSPLSLSPLSPLHTLSVRVALAASHRDGNKCIERRRWDGGRGIDRDGATDGLYSN